MGHADRWQELERVLSGATDKPHVILLGGHPDPDSIGSALAHKRLCERLGVSATIAHVLPISRAENRAMVKLLNVPMVKMTDSDELETFGYLSLVDASQSEQTIKVPDSLQLLTVVDHHRPAAIPMAADYILRREDIDTVVVYGIVEDRIDGSLRTRRASVDPAAFMQNAFGDDSQGRPYGGGRADMGGFRVPLGLLAETEDEETLWALVKDVVRQRVARVVPDLDKNDKRKD